MALEKQQLDTVDCRWGNFKRLNDIHDEKNGKNTSLGSFL